MSESVEHTRSLLRWMHEERLRGLDIGPMLRAHTLTELRETLREHPQWRTVGVYRYLLNAAHEELERNPNQALTITTVLLEYLDETDAPEHAQVPLLLLRAAAWKEHANALRVTGDMPGAMRAVEKALQLLSGDARCEYELATVRMLAAHLRQEQGDFEGALELMRCSREVFDRLGERGQAARARTLEAAFIFDGNPTAAETLWLGAIEDARAIGDEETIARITQNLGVVAAIQGDEEKATLYFDRALELFDKRGMTAERTRVRWGRAALYRKQGRLDSALRELEETRKELASDGRALQAAQASLEIIELLLALDRGEMLHEELGRLSKVFARAGMNDQTRRALAYLNETKALTAARVTAVRDFLGVLEANPHASFVAPTPV